MGIGEPLERIWPPRLVKPYAEAIESETNWLDPEVTQRLRKALGPTVRRTFYFWTQRARKTEIPLPRLLRNLVAVSTADQLDRIRITLRWITHFPVDPSYSLAKQLLNEIPKRASAVGVVETLLFAEEKITLRDLHDSGLVSPTQIPTLLNAAPDHLQNTLPATFVGFARTFADWVVDANLILASFECGKYKKLHSRQFAQLPPNVKATITENPNLRKKLLLKNVVEQIIKNERRALQEHEEREFNKFKLQLRNAEPSEIRNAVRTCRAMDRQVALAHALGLALDRSRIDAQRVFGRRYEFNDFNRDWQALSRFRRDLLTPYVNFAPWSRFAESLCAQGKPLPRGFATAFRQSDVPTLRAATVHNPKIFAKHALAAKNVDRLIATAFRDPAIGQAIDPYLSRAQRQRFLKLAYREAETPYQEAIFETALVSSLGSTSALSRLAHHWSKNSSSQDPKESPFDALYHTYKLPKRSGGSRRITAPQDTLKYVQRMLIENGFSHVKLPPEAHGFRKGHSIKSNAQPHVGQPAVVNVDIHRFFDSTERRLILRAVRRLADGHLSERTIQFITDLCTYQGALPTGAPTSPYIANIIMTGVDRALAKVCARHGVTYTRYADDLTFSGPVDAKRILPFAEKVLAELGYSIDRKKTQIFRRGRRQMVTGVVVNERPNLPRRIRRRLRAAVHQRSQGQQPVWQGRPLSDQGLAGHLSHLNMFSPVEANALLQMLASAGLVDRIAREQ
jgi:retron-type reverse transcriptase